MTVKKNRPERNSTDRYTTLSKTTKQTKNTTALTNNQRTHNA